MDRHDNLAVSVATATTPQHEGLHGLSDRDRQAVHRLFRDMRRVIGAPSLHRIAALPHP
jgi:hypothetical protein